MTMVEGHRHQRVTGRLRGERGVSLIHVAIAIFILMSFSAFVLDHGVLMVARSQTQNAADAAALAGVITRVKDEPGDANPPANGVTDSVIEDTVNQHKVFGSAGTNTGRTWEYSCPAGVSGWCVQVYTHRDGTNGGATLPVYFATLFGMASQNTRAYAAAVAKSANGTRCLKPWLIPDKWDEQENPPNQFNPGDVYTPYNYATGTPGTGYTLDDVGDTVTLKPGQPSGAISPSDYFEIEEANLYEESIVECRITKTIGDTVTALPGSRKGPTKMGVDALTANGPVDVVVGLFSPLDFGLQDRQSGTFDLTIVGFLGVRVSGALPNGDINGVITGGIGEDMGAGPMPTGRGSLIKQIQLVR